MSMFGFLKSFGQGKVGDAVQTGLDALVRWDPKGATRAELIEMEKHLDDLGKKVAVARDGLTTESTEYEQISALYNQRYAAAHKLEEQLAGETDPARQASLQRSIAMLVEQLEKQQADIDQHAKDKADAEDLLHRLEETYAEAARKMRTAKDDLSRAERDLQRAAGEKERAQQRAEAAKEAAGLSVTTSGLNVALDAMHRQAQAARQDAEAARLKADALKVSDPEREDPNIAAAMAEVSGKPAAPTSVSDRLAALKPKG